MPYIGRDLNRGNYLKLDDISSSFNGSTQTFNLTVGGSAFTPGSAFSILVSVGGVIQEPESAYQVENSEITFANAPTAQDSFFCIALGVALGIGVPGNGTVNGAQMSKPFNYDGFFYLDDANNRVGIGSAIPSQLLDVAGTIKALNYSGPISNASGISTFYDLRVTNNLTVEGSTSTLDTDLIGVDRVEVGANSNSIVGVAVTQSGTADILRLYDGSTQVVTVDDVGNVGIASAIPSKKLDVVGDTLIQGQLTVARSTHPQIIIKDSDTTGANDQNGISFVDAANTQYGFIGQSGTSQTMYINLTNTINPIRLQINNSTKLEIGNTGVYVDNANFFVNGGYNGYFSGSIDINSNAPTLNFNDANGEPDYRIFVNAGVFSIKDVDSDVDRITIASNGKVGVNTTGPSQQFTSYTESGYPILANGPSNGIGLSNQGVVVFGTKDLGSYGSGSLDASHLQFKISGSPKVTIMSGGAIGIHTTTGTNTISIGGAEGLGVKFHNFTSGNMTYVTVQSGDMFATNIGGTGYATWHTQGNEKMRLDNNGRLGIGTQTPSKTLHVDGTIFASGATTSLDGGIRLQPNNSGTNYGGVIYGGAHNDNNTAIYMRRGADGGNNTIDINSYGMFRVFTNGALASQTERLRITNDGFTGIGTVAPTTGLSIGKFGDYSNSDGNTYWMPKGKWISVWNNANDLQNNTDYWVGFNGQYTASTNSVNICLAPNRANLGNQQGMYISGEATGTSTSDITFGKIIGGSGLGQGTSGSQRATKSELVRFASDGRVGIATAAAGSQLSVGSASNNSGLTLDAYGTNRSRLIFRNSVVRGTQTNIDAHNGDLRLVVNSGNRLNVTTSGNIGIGITNPDQHLEVFKASGTNLVKVSTQANSTVGLEIKKTGSTTQTWRIVDGQTVNGALEFYDVTDSTTRLMIDTGGRILINRTSTHSSVNERLSVNGMTSIQNNSTSTAPLYVFNEETTSDGTIQPFIYFSDGSGLRAGIGVQRSTSHTIINGHFGLSLRTGSSGISGTERLRIHSNGNVSIQTNDVGFSGAGTLRINSGSTSGALNLDGGATNHGGEINLTGGSNGGRIQFRTGQGSGQQTVKMRLDEHGHLQIGNEANYLSYNSAATKLMIGNHTDGHAGITILSNTTHGGYIMFSDNAGGGTNAYRGQIEYQHGGSDADHMRFLTASGERLRIQSTGQLNVSGNNNGNPIGITIKNINTAAYSHARLRLEAQNASSYSNIYTDHPNTALRLEYNSSNSVYIKENGRVGILTSNPQSALHVRGAGGIRVDALGNTPQNQNENVLTDGAGNPYISGTPWFETSPYLYNTSNSPNMDYYWIKIVQYLGYSAICYIEYMCHSDSNYPRSVHGRIDVAKYANASISISHNTITPLTGITPEVVIDSYKRVWVKMNGAQWNSDFRFRVIYSEGTDINTNFTVGTDNNSTTVGKLLHQDATPQNKSGVIEPGATMRWNLDNANPPLYWGGTNATNNANVSTTAGTFGDGIQDYGSGESHFNRMRIKGRISCVAGYNDHGMIMNSNYIGVNNGSQPVLMALKSQKNTTLQLDRMYSHGEIIQFKQNASNVGYINVTGSASSHVTSGSDIRLKKDIEDWTEEVLPYFKSLKPQKFRFNSEDETTEKTKGYMAQDNLDKFPEAYPLNSQDDRYWFAPQHMIPYLMKALQEEIIKREEIEAKYNALEARISALEGS